MNDLQAHISRKLHEGRCPGKFAWGECPVISPFTNYEGKEFHIVTVYWWRTPPDHSVVRGWVEEAGWQCLSVNHVLWEDNGCSEEDNASVVHWDIYVGKPEDE